MIPLCNKNKYALFQKNSNNKDLYNVYIVLWCLAVSSRSSIQAGTAAVLLWLFR